MFELKGVYTPIATPFDDNGQIAYDALEGNLNFWLSSKLEGLVVLGSNGEFVALRESEKEALIRFVCQKTQHRKKIIVGIGGNCLDETIHLAEVSADAGADAVLVVTPFYYKGAMKDDVLEKYFITVADKSPLPVVIYNMPGNTGVNTSASLLIKLSKHPNIIGVKDTSGNIAQITETAGNADPSFTVFAGNWSFFLPSLCVGAKGATLALANVLPNECVELMELYEKGEMAKAEALAVRLMPVNAAITAKYGQGGLKVAMELVGLYGGEPRSPLLRPDAKGQAEIRQILIDAGVKLKDDAQAPALPVVQTEETKEKKPVRNLLDSIPSTLLMGAGPSSVSPAVYHAMSRTTIGHLDPYFMDIMEELKDGLRTLFGTRNELTMPLSGTGSLGMEASFVNLVERGDKVLVLVNGVFGGRMVDVASRLGANVTELDFEWGKPIDVDAVRDALRKDRYQIVAMIFAETSTGVRNPIEAISDLVREHGALFVVDAVTALGGMPMHIDDWGVDVCYSGSQKCLACPPGAAPISFSERALTKIRNRSTKVPNWYVDVNLLSQYLGGGKRVYHHTAPINTMYALYQAVYNILEEGTANVFARHIDVHNYLVDKLNGMGWEMLVDPSYQLPMLNTVKVPAGVDEADLRARLMKEYGIEINGGLGQLAGKIVRIGLMGYNCTKGNVDRLTDAMKEILK